MTCPDCKGSGRIETGAVPGCGCLMHTSAGGAECTCQCEHTSEQCKLCEGIGLLASEPDY